MIVGSRNNYMRIMFEMNKLKQLFNKVHEQFLKAIDNMEFHPTLGKKRKGLAIDYTDVVQKIEMPVWLIK